MRKFVAAVAGSPFVFVGVLGGLAALLIVFALLPAVRVRQAMEKRLAMEKSSLANLKAEESSLRATYRASREDPVFLEAVARKVLGMRGQGEVPIDVPALAAAPSPAPVRSGPRTDLAGIPISLIRWASIAVFALLLLAVNAKGFEAETAGTESAK